MAKLRQQLYGRSAERARSLIDQLELALDDATADASQAEIIAGEAAAAAGIIPRPRPAARTSAA
ncbi:IS66 family transposase [Aquidulcibacter paucihalophilus]